jgi:NADPH:quinone reductase-like Zn-dependent oxidoreductase
LKAVIYTRYGGPEVLQIKEVEKPSPRDHEVLIKVYAVSINDWDWGLIQGEPFITRIFFSGLRPKKQILGSDVAGKIESVGKNVQLFKPGDEVFGDLSGEWGGFAEYVCANEKKLALKPPSMTFEEAAAIPQAAMLAVQGLRAGHIQPGQKLLMNGAGGGVGTFAIQLAKMSGLKVTAVDSSAKFDMLRSFGVTDLIDYTKEDFTKNQRRYDMILDVKTNRSPFAYLRALEPYGTYATVGGLLSRLFQAFSLSPLISMFSKKKVKVVALKANKDLSYMIDLFEAGKVRPVIDGHYRLDDIEKAFKLFANGDHKGKLVISVAT